MSLNLDAINSLSIADLMELRVAVNNRASEVEQSAMESLKAGEVVPNFSLQKGKTSRYIEDQDLYELTLRKAFEGSYEDICVTKKVVGLTGAEKAIKDQFDSEDATEIITALQESLGKKTATSKLVYTPTVI